MKKTSYELICQNSENIKQVLLKKAMGFKIKETVDEYVINDDDEVKLKKRKVSVKYFPPDINAIELVLKTAVDINDLSKLTDDELEQEKQKLIKQLKLLDGK